MEDMITGFIVGFMPYIQCHGHHKVCGGHDIEYSEAKEVGGQ